MSQKYIKEIRRFRKEIREANFNKSLYNMCTKTLKNEVSKNKKLTTYLNKIVVSDGAVFPKDFISIFEYWIIKTSSKTQKTQQELIEVQLKKIASDYSISFFEKRVTHFKESNRLTKRLKSEETKNIESLDKVIKKNSTISSNNLSINIIALEDLSIDLNELKSVYDSSKKIYTTFYKAHDKLFHLSEIEFTNLPKNSTVGKELFDIYNTLVEINPSICAFVNKLAVKTTNRDVLIHLELLKDFLEKYISSILIDWYKNKRIKNMKSHLKSTLKSTELLQVYLKNKIESIERELMIRRESVESQIGALVNS